MKDNPVGFTTIDEYIATFPAEIQKILQGMRAAIRAAAPDAEEKISYQLPTFFLKGNLAHFAAFKTILAFIQHREGSRNSRLNCQNIKARKARFNSPSRNRCRWN